MLEYLNIFVWFGLVFGMLASGATVSDFEVIATAGILGEYELIVIPIDKISCRVAVRRHDLAEPDHRDILEARAILKLFDMPAEGLA